MRYFLFISIFVFFLVPIYGVDAITGGSARFDFTSGQPTIVDNQTSTCNNTATIRYDFISGQPTPVFDATATCTTAAAAVNYQSIYWDE